MSLSEKLVQLLDSSLLLFVHGLNQVKSKLLKLPMVNSCIVDKHCQTLLILVLILHKKRKLSTLESLLLNKKMTLNDKYHTYSPNIQIMTLLRIVVLESIGKEKDYKPFWNTQCKEISMKLWLPTETECPDLDLSLSNGLSQKMEGNSESLIQRNISPLNKTYLTTCCPLYKSTPANKWVEEDTLKTLRIRLKVSPEQRKIFRNWFGTNRYVYNKTINTIQEGHKINFYDLRNKLVTYTGNEDTINDWEILTPKEIRAQAVNDCVKAYKTCFSQLKKGLINNFNISYKSKHKKSDSVFIPKQSLKIKEHSVIFYPRIDKTLKTGFQVGKKTKKKLRNLEIKHDCRLSWDGDYYWLCIPIDAQKQENKSESICALDPGVRTFMTTYDPEGKSLEFKKSELMDKYYQKIRMMQSQGKKQTQINKYFRKIKNQVDHLHWNTIKYLLNNYQVILLPHFESQEMIKSKKLHKSTKRTMNSLSHYTFKQRLIYKASLYKDKKILLVDEAYTSKTCGWCGNLNDKLGTNKVFKCPTCGIKLDRDFNGARNILIKNWASFQARKNLD